VLVVVQAHLEVDWSRPEWIEDELVRSGAREARLLEDGFVSVTVCANSRDAAEDFVRELLERVSAKAVAVVGAELVLA
jgi:RNA-binding protein YhbY